MKKLIIWFMAAVAALVLLMFFALVAAAKYYASGEAQPEAAERSVYAESKDPHQITLIDSGIASLQRRLALIDSARETIELEFFIYNIDAAARLVTQALQKKAREGVKVRILVDFAGPVFQFKPIFAKVLKAEGIEVKYYNTMPLYRIFSIQHRGHRKLLIVDGKTFLTGGRNIADEYFDLSPNYNFLDTDIEVTGPITKPVLQSFDLYWSSPLAVDAYDPAVKPEAEEIDSALRFFTPTEEIEKLKSRIMREGSMAMKTQTTSQCSDLIFVTDFPEKGEGSRKVFPTIVSLMQEARAEVWVESPYFVIKQGGYDVLAQINKQGAKLKVLTNNLYATDAYYTVAALYPDLEWIAKTGLELHGYNGFGPQTRWGIHSKRAVVDGKIVLIGTYNVDPRSANLNSELMIVCRDSPDLARAVLKNIAERAVHAAPIVKDGSVDKAALFGKADFNQKLLFYLSLPFAKIFDFLL